MCSLSSSSYIYCIRTRITSLNLFIKIANLFFAFFQGSIHFASDNILKQLADTERKNKIVPTSDDDNESLFKTILLYSVGIDFFNELAELTKPEEILKQWKKLPEKHLKYLKLLQERKKKEAFNKLKKLFVIR